VFVGGVPLLERRRNSNGADEWQPRPAIELNRDLSKRYDMIIAIAPKMAGLATVCRALNRGDLIHAQIALLHLQIPDPPISTKSGSPAVDKIDLERALRSSGLLKIQEAWDEAKHPRWPAGSPDSVGGQFAPAGADAGSSPTQQNASSDHNERTIPAQLTLPAPFELPGIIPFPSEIMPAPVIPNINPRDLPKNPYPDRPECKEEWAEAYRRCYEYLATGRLGRDDHRGMGDFLYQCVLGQVSEECGGSPKSKGYRNRET
jgi:hypothetical protein